MLLQASRLKVNWGCEHQWATGAGDKYHLFDDKASHELQHPGSGFFFFVLTLTFRAAAVLNLVLGCLFSNVSPSHVIIQPCIRITMMDGSTGA